ncbi:DUF6427 family protein [Sphingobacterium corticis]|uniref:DUF6427 family protein n=1 Tax=Sphingobacterium corticis TaxID=1812823 RepID=A0ABW5NM31_9SPHI
MIIRQHRNLSALNILLVSIVGLLLCLGVFIHLPDALAPVLFEPALNNLIDFKIGDRLPPYANVLITLALTLFQAFQLNRIVNYYNFLGKPSFLTALMFMTLVSLFLPFLILSPTLICNFLTIWMLSKLFKIYKLSNIRGRMYDLGIIVALGSLVYFPFIVMLALLWASLLIFRPFDWREWLTPLLGFITVYFLLGVVYYWNYRLDDFLTIFSPFTTPFSASLHVDRYDLIALAPVAIAMLLFLSLLKDQYFKSVVHVRKSFKLLFYMLVLILASFFLDHTITINHFLLCVPPLSIYLAYYFTYAKSKWIYETMYLLMVAGIIASQFI